jgi:hypothetical protein
MNVNVLRYKKRNILTDKKLIINPIFFRRYRDILNSYKYGIDE